MSTFIFGGPAFGADAAPCVDRAVLAGILCRPARRDREAEVPVHRHHPRKIRARPDLAALVAVERGALAERLVVVAHQEVDAAVEHGPRALERAARDEVHAAGECLARHVGRGRVRDLDARDVVEVEKPDLDRAAGAGRAREADAADGDRRVGRGRAVDRDRAAVAAAEIDDATSYIDDIISPLRAEAGQYYKGEPFGNEEEGRSQVVSMDVRDTVQAIMPSIMRVFFGSSNVVEYAPNGPEDVANAEQATDYVNYCLTRDNNLFSIMYDTFKDALIRKNGIAKIWWNEEKNVETFEFEGLTEEAYTVLSSDPTIEVVEVEVEYGETGEMAPDGSMGVMQSPPEYS